MPDFLRYRQIHLDFHTSEQLPNIGGEFDAAAWAQQLVDAHVDSITCFARGHHGMIFYDTQANPERRHPHLQCNLLAEQIEAAHARNIRLPIYTTVQWDYYTAQHEPQWLQIAADGSIQGQRPYEAGFYAKLCLNTPYVDFLKAHVDEMFALLPAVDGLFFDIVQDQDCSCSACRQEMLARGIDPSCEAERQAFGQEVTDRFKRAMSAHVRGHSQDSTIFYNSGHVGPRQKATGDTYSHWELESLPSGGWGYMHFPLSQRYARTTGHDSLGMTGKFHTSWGDFQSYKNAEALQFECFQMLALNAKCSIGDQLHPTGRLDQATYDLVGPVYREVARKEPWCRGARPLTDIGVFTLEEFTGERLTAETVAAVRMLQEGGHQFDVVDSETNWDGYRLLILPDAVTLDEGLARKVADYLAGGGKLIASFESGLTPDLSDFALPAWGVRKTGDGPVDGHGDLVRGRNFPKGDYVDYLRAEGALAGGLRNTDYVMYIRRAGDRRQRGHRCFGENRPGLLRPHLEAFLLAPADPIQRPAGRSSRNPNRRRDLLRPSHLPPVPPERAPLVQAAAFERAGDAPARPAAAARWTEQPVDGGERAARRKPLGRPPAPLRPRAPRPGFRRDRRRSSAPRRRRKPAHAGAGGGRPLRPRRRDAAVHRGERTTQLHPAQAGRPPDRGD